MRKFFYTVLRLDPDDIIKKASGEPVEREEVDEAEFIELIVKKVMFEEGRLRIEYPRFDDDGEEYDTIMDWFQLVDGKYFVYEGFMYSAFSVINPNDSEYIDWDIPKDHELDSDKADVEYEAEEDEDEESEDSDEDEDSP